MGAQRYCSILPEVEILANLQSSCNLLNQIGYVLICCQHVLSGIDQKILNDIVSSYRSHICTNDTQPLKVANKTVEIS